jgi:hypothetical protein
MTDNITRGEKGEPIPAGLIVVRFASAAMDTEETKRAHESHFSLSSKDEESELKSLSVWVRALTPPHIAIKFMPDNKTKHPFILNLNVDDIRGINYQPEAPDPPLDVVWDPLEFPDSDGHAGITGLMRPSGTPKARYKNLRARLALLATVELLTLSL